MFIIRKTILYVQAYMICVPCVYARLHVRYSLPDDGHKMFETCRRQEELNWNNLKSAFCWLTLRNCEVYCNSLYGVQNSSFESLVKVSSCGCERVEAERVRWWGVWGLRRAQSCKGRRAVSLPLWVLLDPVGVNSTDQSLTRHLSVEGECVGTRPWRISVSTCLARSELRWRFW